MSEVAIAGVEYAISKAVKLTCYEQVKGTRVRIWPVEWLLWGVPNPQRSESIKGELVMGVTAGQGSHGEQGYRHNRIHILVPGATADRQRSVQSTP